MTEGQMLEVAKAIGKPIDAALKQLTRIADALERIAAAGETILHVAERIRKEGISS